MGIYKCPADYSKIIGTQTPRVRSYAMSTAMNWVNCGSVCLDSFESQVAIRKFAQIVNPGPAQSSVVLDEHEDSIDNGACGIYPLGTAAATYLGYWNVPATRHGKGCVLSFADGHAEYWRWKGAYLFKPAAQLKFTTTAADDRDALRIEPADGAIELLMHEFFCSANLSVLLKTCNSKTKRLFLKKGLNNPEDK